MNLPMPICFAFSSAAAAAILAASSERQGRGLVAMVAVVVRCSVWFDFRRYFERGVRAASFDGVLFGRTRALVPTV